jgi:hypothetical protein
MALPNGTTYTQMTLEAEGCQMAQCARHRLACRQQIRYSSGGGDMEVVLKAAV